MIEKIKELSEYRDLDDDSFITLIDNSENENQLFTAANAVRKENYGIDVYIRGLIEVSNYCKNNCFYCGIRNGNKDVVRYRLTKEEILSCCFQGYMLGFRTFVLQGGEDNEFTDEFICDVVAHIKSLYPDCAVTLSLGEKSYESYESYYKAGADRYLLRHETANNEHYEKLHPKQMKLSERIECLYNLKKIGYQVGAGIMVGSPYQTTENILEDLRFLQKLQPDMIGIGPFMSHCNTPFGKYPNGDLHKSLRLISILRLIFPYSLIPATTALSSIAPNGRGLGLRAGANIIMPNLSPVENRRLYELYDNKLYVAEEAAEYLKKLCKKVEDAGYRIVTNVGHVKR